MKIEKEIKLLDEILEPYKKIIGNDFLRYKNHIYRMLNYTFALSDFSDYDKKKLIIASAFHDIGIWTKNTVDYLPPSILEAKKYLKNNNLEDIEEEICLIIDLHHKIRPVKNEKYPLIEYFRKGDLVDFSMGIFKFGLKKSFIKEVNKEFPSFGFHKMLLKLSLKQIKKDPLNPAPMMKL